MNRRCNTSLRPSEKFRPHDKSYGGLPGNRLVVHQFWIDGYKDFNFMRASAVVKRQSTFMAS